MRLKQSIFIRCTAWAAAMLLGTICWLGPAGSRRANAAPKSHPEQLLVKPKPKANGAALKRLHELHGGAVTRRFEAVTGLELVRIPPGQDMQEVLRRYWESGLVEYAEPDLYWEASALPNDPGFSSQWALHNEGRTGGKPDADIDAPEAWNLQSSASNVVVAVIDTGVLYTHPDLAPNLWKNPGEISGNGTDDDRNGYVDDVVGINAITRTGDPRDDQGHGTHVAGTLAAAGNNGVGISGVAWKAQIMALKFLGTDGGGLTSDAIACIDYAIAKKAQIINASWGGAGSSLALRDAISRSRQSGILFVAAAGNDARNNDVLPTYPASYDLDNIVSVAATDPHDQLDTRYSNYGRKSVDIAAPGTDILSCFLGNQYAYSTGTSMAAPHVAGALALIRGRYPSEPYLTTIDRLISTVDPLPSLQEKTVSGGRLNLERALALNTQQTPAVPKPSSLEVLAWNPLKVRITGEAGRTYEVQESPDLANWRAVGTYTLPAEGTLIVDLPAQGEHGFFRLATQ